VKAGSRQADTGSSAIKRSTSSARALALAYRFSGFKAIAFKQTASSARSIERSRRLGGWMAPPLMAESTSASSVNSTGGLPVKRQ
jgi:hypothetical protein